MKKIFFGLSFLCMFLFGCSAVQETQFSDNLASVEKYAENNDFLVFQESVISMPSKESYCTYKVDSFFEIDTEPIVEFFFPDKTPKVTLTTEYDGQMVFEFRVSDEAAYLFYNGGQFFYFDRYFDQSLPNLEIDLPIRTQNYRTDFSDLPITNELDGFLQETAVSQAEEILDFLGYSYITPPTVCVGINTVCLDQMKQLPIASSYYMQTLGYLPEFTEEDEYYFIFYQLQLDGNPLFTANYDSSLTRNMPSDYIAGSYAVFYIGRDRILSVQANPNYYIIPDGQSDFQKIISIEEVKSIVRNYYENYILQNIVTVKTIDFSYVITHDNQGNRLAVPAWIVYCDRDNEMSHYGELLFINAFTGELLLL